MNFDIFDRLGAPVSLIKKYIENRFKINQIQIENIFTCHIIIQTKLLILYYNIRLNIFI